MRSILFSASECFYQSELKRLDKILKKQLAQRKRLNDDLKHEIFKITSKLDENQHPGDPRCKNENGTLTKHGIKICYRLFDLGASAHAAAHMMSMSISTARTRKKMWQNKVENRQIIA